MKTTIIAVAFAGLFAIAAGAAFGQTSGVERLYVVDCGTSVGPDKSRWTPGVDMGKPLDMVGNCYLIKHAQGWMGVGHRRVGCAAQGADVDEPRCAAAQDDETLAGILRIKIEGGPS